MAQQLSAKALCFPFVGFVSSPLEHFLHKNLEDLPEIPTDKTDKPNLSLGLSALSVSPRESLGSNQKIYLRRLLTTDKKFLSGLSVVSSPLEHFLHKNLEDLYEIPTDKTDKLNLSFDLSGLSGTPRVPSREFLSGNLENLLKAPTDN